jgi:hypothetical protein
MFRKPSSSSHSHAAVHCMSLTETYGCSYGTGRNMTAVLALAENNFILVDSVHIQWNLNLMSIRVHHHQRGHLWKLQPQIGTFYFDGSGHTLHLRTFRITCGCILRVTGLTAQAAVNCWKQISIVNSTQNQWNCYLMYVRVDQWMGYLWKLKLRWNCLLLSLRTLLQDESAYHTNSKSCTESVIWLAKLQSFIAFDIIQNNVQLNISIRIDYKMYMGKDGCMVVLWK